MISIENIKSFIQGYSNLLLDKLNKLPLHIKEQVIWRASKAKVCTEKGSCIHCGCSTKNLALYFAEKGCKKTNPCYPYMMDKQQWELFKETNKI